MQVYRELRVLTARPTPDEEALAPHALYGVRPPAEPGSAALVAGAALAGDGGDAQAGRLPILMRRHRPLSRRVDGGAGRDSRTWCGRSRRGAALLAELGPERLHARLAVVDPDDRRPSAAVRQPADRPRLGGLAGHRPRPRRMAGRAGDRHPQVGASLRSCSARPRPALRAAIAARFEAMLADGALERCGRCWRWAWIPRCRRCAPTACRSWRPISAASSRWPRQRSGQCWSPAHTPSGRRRGSGTINWPEGRDAYDPCADAGTSGNFRKEIRPEIFDFIRSLG